MIPRRLRRFCCHGQPCSRTSTEVEASDFRCCRRALLTDLPRLTSACRAVATVNNSNTTASRGSALLTRLNTGANNQARSPADTAPYKSICTETWKAITPQEAERRRARSRSPRGVSYRPALSKPCRYQSRARRVDDHANTRVRASEAPTSGLG